MQAIALDNGQRYCHLRNRVNAQPPLFETKPDLPLEIAHLLLIDAVGYSKLLVNEQIELPQALNHRPQHRMFPGGGSERQAHPSANR